MTLTASAVYENPLVTGRFLRGFDEGKACGVVKRLNGSPQPAHTFVSSYFRDGLQIAWIHLRATQGRRLLVRQSVWRNNPYKFRWCLDILSECTLVRECAAVNKACNVVANLRAGHVLADSNSYSGEIAA